MNQPGANATTVNPAAEGKVRPFDEIPQASGDFILGSLRSLFGDIRAFLTAEYTRLGPVFRVRVLHRRFIVLAGVEANQFVAREGGQYLSARETWQDQAAVFGATGSLLTMDGPAHTLMRRSLSSGYSREAIDSHLSGTAQLIRDELSRWPVGLAMPGFPTVQRLIAVELGIRLAGFAPHEYLDDLIYFVRTVLQTTVTRQQPRLMLHTPKFRRARRRIWEMADKVRALNTSGHEGCPRGNLIRDIIKLSRERPDVLPESDMRISVLGPFIAGLDTAASTCAFLLYALLKDPALLASARAEADQAFSREDNAPEFFDGLDIHRRALQETLRMYPIAPALQRTVKAAFNFGGYEIPAGETVVVATTVPHYLPEYFPDPNRFDIERYAAGRRRDLPPRCLAPFGLGAHTCLGAGLAESLIILTVATILRELDLVMDPPEYTLKIDPKPTPSPDSDFRFRIVSRRKAT